jgi:hypothetical protein
VEKKKREKEKKISFTLLYQSRKLCHASFTSSPSSSEVFGLESNADWEGDKIFKDVVVSIIAISICQCNDVL